MYTSFTVLHVSSNDGVWVNGECPLLLVSCFPSKGLPRGNQGSAGIQAELHRLSGPSHEGVRGKPD